MQGGILLTPLCFALVDGERHVNLWNVHQDMEALVVRCEIPNQQKVALNRVMSMQQVGTQHATNLITASNDGRLCIVSQPQEYIDMKHDQTRRAVWRAVALFPRERDECLVRLN